MRNLAVVILAAGRGTRLKSDIPKALHRICGVAMLDLVLAKVKGLRPSKILVVAGHKIDEVRRLVGRRARVVWQKPLLGSAHAVAQAAPLLKNFKGSVAVVYCDLPVISAATLEKIFQNHRRKATDCSLLSVRLNGPGGYGRVVRSKSGAVQRIVEEMDASAGEKKIREINVGCYLFRPGKLFGALAGVGKNPRKKEYYLTDVVGILSKEGRVEAIETPDREEALGVNSRMDLMRVEQIMQQRVLREWIERGVRIRDPRTTTIDADVKIGEGTQVLPNTVIEQGSVIGRDCVIGPFARVRGASRIGHRVVIGNFVEVVRSRVGDGTQIKHLSYIGDARIGASVNVGAGTITANFDGNKKHPTVIRDKAQIGSGTILIAPVTVGRAARTGAGAVVTKGKNVPDRAVVAGVPAKRLSTQ